MNNPFGVCYLEDILLTHVKLQDITALAAASLSGPSSSVLRARAGSQPVNRVTTNLTNEKSLPTLYCISIGLVVWKLCDCCVDLVVRFVRAFSR